MNCSDASWLFACPKCGGPLAAVSPVLLSCSQDRLEFPKVDGVWRMLLPERAGHFQQFISEYETVRRSEGWRGAGAAYYRALPQVAAGDPNRPIWQIRARSVKALTAQIIRPPGKALRVLDLGAGNGWLSYRLRQMGHCPLAVDLLTNETDGLGARVHYDEEFPAVQAEFDHLPLAEGQADLAIFNGSFHYTADYAQTLRAVKRLLSAGGRIVIMDSPLYRDRSSGEQMVAERAEAFARQHGFRGDAVAHEGYLTFARLEELAAALGLEWQLFRPAYGWRWAIRPWLARLRGRREPATFLLIVGTFGEKTGSFSEQ